MADGAANKGIEQIFSSSASIDRVTVFLKGKAVVDISNASASNVRQKNLGNLSVFIYSFFLI